MVNQKYVGICSVITSNPVFAQICHQLIFSVTCSMKAKKILGNFWRYTGNEFVPEAMPYGQTEFQEGRIKPTFSDVSMFYLAHWNIANDKRWD